MRVLVTGANGFIGKNLISQLAEQGIPFSTFVKGDSFDELKNKIESCSFIVHLAGINRPKNNKEFIEGNVDLTKKITEIINSSELKMPIIFSSSSQVGNQNNYAQSKKRAEGSLLKLNKFNGNHIYNFRLPNVFGKWSKPNYNSVVATFCHNVVNNVPIEVHDKNSIVNLVYVDDVVRTFIEIITSKRIVKKDEYKVSPQYTITVGDLADKIKAFKDNKKSLIVDKVGVGLTRALYSTFISYYNPTNFSYNLIKNEDQRGSFVEMLKTKDSGQISYFTAHPGVTRGGHYHHSKNEKFLVVKGNAHFAFQNIISKEFYEIETSDEKPTIVETIPGWSHNITNIGQDEMIVMLWANEIFDTEIPDTFTYDIKR